MPDRRHVLNKIVKSGGKWRSLPRRVSPVLNVLQALAVTVAVMAAVSALKYRTTITTSPVKSHRRTTVMVDENNHPLTRVSRALDPASFLLDHPGSKALPAATRSVSGGLLKLELPRPQKPETLPALSKFSKFKIEPLPSSGDATINSGHHRPPALLPEVQAVMYDEYGNVISRWQYDGKSHRNMTLFRVDGEGVLQHFSIIASCGSSTVDQQALQRAQQLQLPRGLYSVCYPGADKNVVR